MLVERRWLVVGMAALAAVVSSGFAVQAATNEDRIARAGVVSRVDLPDGFRATRAPELPLEDVAGCEPVAAAVTQGVVAQASSRVLRSARSSASGDRLVTLVEGSSYVFADTTGAVATIASLDDRSAEGCANGVAAVVAAAEGRDLLTVETRDGGGNIIPPVIVQDDILDPEGPGEVAGWFAAYSTVPAGIDQSGLTGLSEEIRSHDSVLAAVRVKRAVALVRFDGTGLGSVVRPEVEATLTTIAKRLAKTQRR